MLPKPENEDTIDFEHSQLSQDQYVYCKSLNYREPVMVWIEGDSPQLHLYSRVTSDFIVTETFPEKKESFWHFVIALKHFDFTATDWD